jgi:hypothetical protein
VKEALVGFKKNTAPTIGTSRRYMLDQGELPPRRTSVDLRNVFLKIAQRFNEAEPPLTRACLLSQSIFENSPAF